MKFNRPINTTNPNVTNSFGPSHLGVDYGYAQGTPVYAAADGKVILEISTETRQWIANTASDPFKLSSGNRALRTEDYGNFVKLSHVENYQSIYAHLKPGSITVKLNETVKAGQKIGEVGSTGNSTGNHLHWEPRLAERAIDPAPLMDYSFINYSNVVPKPDDNNMTNITIETKLYEKLVTNSTKWDKTVGYVELASDPATTAFEDVQRVIAGFKSRVTDLQNQLNQAVADKINREEQVGRLKDQLTSEQKLRTDLNVKLNEAIAKYTETQKIYEDRLTEMQNKIDVMGREKGTLNETITALTTENTNLKNKNSEIVNNTGKAINVGEALNLLFLVIWNKIKNVPLQ